MHLIALLIWLNAIVSVQPAPPAPTSPPATVPSGSLRGQIAAEIVDGLGTTFACEALDATRCPALRGLPTPPTGP